MLPVLMAWHPVFSQRRKARKGVWGKHKRNIEVPGDLGGFARKNTTNH
jgi:hypothetical protein